MNEKRRLAGFKALVEDHKNSTHYFEEMDGNFRLWRDLSPQSKLQYIAGDGVFCDVPFERFAEAVRDVFSDLPQEAITTAALRMVLHNERELRGLEKLLPEYDRLEPAPPLVERFKEILELQPGPIAKAPEKEKDRGIER